MKNLSGSTSPLDNSFSAIVNNEMLSEAQVIAWSCALTSEAVVTVLGNLLTIVLFTCNKKLRAKKSLYLVINIAFADLVLGGAGLPLFVYFMATRSRLYFSEFPSFLKIIFMVSSMASFTTAGLISAERFCAIFWPLKHRTIATVRAYKLVILTAWTLAIFFFHGLHPALPLQEYACCFHFRYFIQLVCNCDYLRPQHHYLEKDSAKICSLSPKQSHANPAFD